MHCDPVAAMWSGRTPLIVPCVPTGMNAGVSKTPWRVVMRPSRAWEDGSVWNSSYFSGRSVMSPVDAVNGPRGVVVHRDEARRFLRVLRAVQPPRLRGASEYELRWNNRQIRSRGILLHHHQIRRAGFPQST